jgi:actin-like ATPase involved in cell morphogenesis
MLRTIRVIGFPSKRIVLDPGTAHTLIYVDGRGVALNEPSVVTIRTGFGHIEALGHETEASRGRTLRKFRSARPIRGGVISAGKLFDGMPHCSSKSERQQGHRIYPTCRGGRCTAGGPGLAAAFPSHDDPALTIKGRCLANGVPREASVRGDEIRHTVSTVLEKIMSAIREALEQAPPELSADLVETGIVLAGGSALFRNLDPLIR